MQDNYKKIMDDKIALAKKMSKPTDAMPLFEFFMTCGADMSDKEKEDIKSTLKQSFKKVGKVLLDRALSDGTMTDSEWKKYQKLGLDEEDMNPVLQGYYNKKDGLIANEEDDKVIVLTLSDSPLYKNRKMIQDKFGVGVQTETEMIETIVEKGENDKENI